ncbi:hypothetical protein CA223_06725 [Sphingomonas koreensis]|uniref:Uncharacterized protein n=1 Tax=Sphingomonas koreensis TaxID=93064 RepID=A0A1L6J855_9SPHN|nr:hypothetical protein BRX40_05755 [Sphingomonas koreensis]RSU22810.1 hypothetical protein CA224_05375 [Sphingomonas koreensis]RSU30716.1 hypothetical protein CA222_01170 [Sphingomonas koreensis]RSU31811.1 hypothetical protein CA225_00250 [Sphingomonas koreensis]RSU39268.1 hypothetical protein BRX39_01280 [Sphingomonas koreensis]
MSLFDLFRPLPPARQDVGDPRYDPRVGQRTEVLLDGEPQRHVIAYDRHAGWLTRARVDAGGGMALDDSREGVAIETVYGRVQARWRRP